MASASRAKRTVKAKKVNTSQPAHILKEKMKQQVRALMAEQRRQEEMRREFEAFLAAQAVVNNNNFRNFNYQNNAARRRTRKLRR